MKNSFKGRKKPYTEIGIRRVPCSRCGQPSTQQWQACANGGMFVGICDDCDIALNDYVLTFMRIPNRAKLMREYRKTFAKNK